MTTHELDVTGKLCPTPILKARAKLKTMQAGETLLVLATDPESVADFQIFCSNSNTKLLSHKLDNNVHHFILEKR